jgi:hypothetical protein
LPVQKPFPKSLVEGKRPHHLRDCLGVCDGDGLDRIEQYPVRGNPQEPRLEAAGNIVAFEDRGMGSQCIDVMLRAELLSMASRRSNSATGTTVDWPA